MSVTNRVSLYIFAIVFVLINLFVIHTVLSKVSAFELVEKHQVQIIRNIYDEFPERVYSIIDEQYHDFVADRALIKAFQTGNRKEFAVLGEIYFNRLRINSENADVNIHIHDKDGHSFYRFHKPEQYGDSILDVRPMIARAYKYKEIQKGFEVGKNGLYQRIVYPVFIDGEFWGLFEFGIDIKLLAKSISSTANIRTGILVKSLNLLNFEGYEYQGRKDDEYMVFNNAPELFSHLSADSFSRKYYTINSRYYALIEGFSLKDFQGEEIGEFLFLSDRTALMKWILKYVISVAFLSFFTFGVILMIVKKKIKPLVSDVENHYLKANRELEQINRELEQRVELEIEKNRSNEELLHSKNKLADMGRMISALAHHWRQPLNALGLYVQDVSDSIRSGECDVNYIEEFEKDSMRMISQLSNTIDDFRLFFKSDNDEDDEFEIIFEIINILRLVKSQLDNNYIYIDLKCICGEKVFTSGNILKDPDCTCKMTLVKGYKVEFRQVILSIINNSIDAINSRRARGEINRGKLKLRITRNADNISLAVTDNGGGVPEEITGNVFDPYFTTKEEGQSVGLGLYVAKVIVEQHLQGEISFKNVSGGAEFILDIPVYKGVQEQSEG